MNKIIKFKKLIEVLTSKKYNNKIQLEVEGKFLKTSKHLIIKKLVVPEKLLNDLGMEKQVIKGPTTKNSTRTSLKDMIKDLGVNINKKIDEVDSRLNKRLEKVDSRLDIIEKDVSAIKSLPTIQKEINNLKVSKK